MEISINSMINSTISATIRVLVDGGANCWFKFISENGLDERVEKPHFLTGDMDSITDESKKRLELLNCQEVPTPDQNDTDCTKAVHVIQPYLESKEVHLSVTLELV